MPDSKTKTTLEENVAAFEKVLTHLLINNNGRYAAGNARDGFSCWDTYRDALQYANLTYGLDDFIVKKVLYGQKAETFTRDLVFQPR